VLTISRLSRWSINYYNETANQAQAAAMDRQAAGGGLGEYYSEGDTRVPTSQGVARADSLREITDAETVRGRVNDLRAYLQEFWKNEI
jgi:hypothetical protein